MKADILQLSESLKSLFKETAEQLQGSARRQFMAKVVRGLGVGGQTLAEQELGWNRGTIRKGMQESDTPSEAGGLMNVTAPRADGFR